MYFSNISLSYSFFSSEQLKDFQDKFSSAFADFEYYFLSIPVLDDISYQFNKFLKLERR